MRPRHRRSHVRARPGRLRAHPGGVPLSVARTTRSSLRRVSIRVSNAEVETARASLLRLCPEGFEEVASGEAVELAAYVDPARETALRDAFPSARVRGVAPGWEDAWRDFHRPARVGPLWVGPPWAQPEPGAISVVVDPGRAFGTGAHATTRLCLELLLERPPSSLVDLGCGSGVLAIAAARIGFRPVFALDQDEAATAAARANAERNGVTVEVRTADVLVAPLPVAELACANLEAGLIEPLARRLRGPWLIASGYPAWSRVELAGWAGRRRVEADGWAAELFERR